MERIIDIHCHSTFKPFGHSFRFDPNGINSTNRGRKNSIWHHDPPKGLDLVVEKASGVSKFRQTDFTNLMLGDVSVVILSLYPLEMGFVKNKLGKNIVVDALVNFVNSISKPFIDHAQARKGYFADLQLEYEFLKKLDNRVMSIDGRKAKYKLIKSLDEIEENEEPGVYTIFVLVSIEGGHVFECGIPGKKAVKAEVLKNITTVKNWDYAPLFVSPAHHFYSELCGHAESITVDVVDWVTNQEHEMNTGFTDLGREAVKLLLDKEKGNRIYIDIKHMSSKSRKEYYAMLDGEYQNENIPIVVSHGAVNGWESFDNPKSKNNQHLKRKVLAADINIFDEELVRIEESNGIFGIQVDERRIASKSELKASNLLFGSIRKRKRKKSKLVWNQIQYIAELLDKKGLPAWDIQSIGSDFDGGVNVVNHFWTSKEFPELSNYLEYHATKFMNQRGRSFKEFNQLDPEEIVDKFMGGNAEAFLRFVR